tara:strand:+ start:1256 stop:1693 length:438 start_codon:yes stop_codon:yes gene_type:complete
MEDVTLGLEEFATLPEGVREAPKEAELEEAAEHGEAREDAMEGVVEEAAEDAPAGGKLSSPTKTKPVRKKKKRVRKEMAISFERYQQISNLLVLMLRRHDEGGGEVSERCFNGSLVAQSATIQTYLHLGLDGTGDCEHLSGTSGD